MVSSYTLGSPSQGRWNVGKAGDKIRELVARVKGTLGVTRLDPEVEHHMTRLGMKLHEKRALREVWSKPAKQEGFPTCSACGSMFDPDFTPEQLPAPESDRCSVCVKAKADAITHFKLNRV